MLISFVKHCIIYHVIETCAFTLKVVLRHHSRAFKEIWKYIMKISCFFTDVAEKIFAFFLQISAYSVTLLNQ